MSLILGAKMKRSGYRILLLGRRDAGGATGSQASTGKRRDGLPLVSGGTPAMSENWQNLAHQTLSLGGLSQAGRATGNARRTARIIPEDAGQCDRYSPDPRDAERPRLCLLPRRRGARGDDRQVPRLGGER